MSKIKSKKKGKTNKATAIQTRQRIDEVLRIRLDGAESWDVREYVREKEKEPGSVWFLSDGEAPMSDTHIWRYISWAGDALAESNEKSRKRLRERHLAQRRNLYAKATTAGDYRTALAVLADEAKLLGLYPKEKPENTKLPPGTRVRFIEVVVQSDPAPLALPSPTFIEVVQQ